MLQCSLSCTAIMEAMPQTFDHSTCKGKLVPTSSSSTLMTDFSQELSEEFNDQLAPIEALSSLEGLIELSLRLG